MCIRSKHLLLLFFFEEYFQILISILFLLVNVIYSRDLANAEFLTTNPLADEEALEIMELIAEEEDFQRTLHEENSDELFTANEKGVEPFFSCVFLCIRLYGHGLNIGI